MKSSHYSHKTETKMQQGEKKPWQCFYIQELKLYHMNKKKKWSIEFRQDREESVFSERHREKKQHNNQSTGGIDIN